MRLQPPSGAAEQGAMTQRRMTADQRERVRMVRDFERHALTEACTLPLLWRNRIVVASAKLMGWEMTPSHFIGQDSTDVWLNQ